MSSASPENHPSPKQKPHQIICRPQQSESKRSHTSQPIKSPDAKKEITTNHLDGKTLHRRSRGSFEQKSEMMEKRYQSYQGATSQSQQNRQNSIHTAPATDNRPNPNQPGSNPVLRGNPHPPPGRPVKKVSCFKN